MESIVGEIGNLLRWIKIGSEGLQVHISLDIEIKNYMYITDPQQEKGS